MAPLSAAHSALPAAFECASYRRYNPDLEAFSDDALVAHYQAFGEAEGRRTNELATRNDFVGLIPATAEALEIGPFCMPLLRSAKTKYVDVLPRSKLIDRAKSLGLPEWDVPEIDFVSATGDLTAINGDFDYVLSSHSIEHQPDLIQHLCDVERLLRSGGRYFILLPDKRYCFDHFLPESTLANILEAHHERRGRHSVKSVLEHRVLTTHNDSQRHWLADHGEYMADFEVRTKAALTEFDGADGSYIDVHAWFFTPASARLLLSALERLGYIRLAIERLYPTRRGANEFWMVLRK